MEDKNQESTRFNESKFKANSDLRLLVPQSSFNYPQEDLDFDFKEGGWGWVVVIAASYSFGILNGMVNNYALVYNKLDVVYNGTDNHTLFAGEIENYFKSIKDTVYF